MQATGMNESALKVTIHRLRKRYRELLRATVADTVKTRPRWMPNWPIWWSACGAEARHGKRGFLTKSRNQVTLRA